MPNTRHQLVVLRRPIDSSSDETAGEGDDRGIECVRRGRVGEALESVDAAVDLHNRHVDPGFSQSAGIVSILIEEQVRPTQTNRSCRQTREILRPSRHDMGRTGLAWSPTQVATPPEPAAGDCSRHDGAVYPTLSGPPSRHSLWLLSDKSRAVGRVALTPPLRPGGSEITDLDELWRLPKGSKKPEGMVVIDKHRLLVARDTRSMHDNGLIVERPGSGAHQEDRCVNVK